MREFFKLTKWKVIFTIVLAVIILFYFIPQTWCIGPKGFLACMNNVQKTVYIFLLPFLVAADILNGSSILYLFTTILFLIAQILYLYLLACVILFAFSKIKQKKEVINE